MGEGGGVSIKAQLRDICDNLVGWKKGRRGVEEQQGDLECFALRLE